MASYCTKVTAIHKTYLAAIKRAKSGPVLMRAFRAHKKAHDRLLKSHLREELADAKKRTRKLARQK